jgi:arylformamidase
MPAKKKPSPWIDVTAPLHAGTPHWPDQPDVKLERMVSMDDGAVCNVSMLHMSVHTGTHMDAPLHFVANGIGMDQMPLEATIGPCRVVEIKDKESIKVKHLKPLKLRQGERLLIKTINSKRCWNDNKFVEDFVYISQDAAAYMVEHGIMTVGVDYLSVGGFFKDGIETHHHLLRACVWIIEGLNLSKVKPGKYDLLCLPLKTLNCDGAPARVLLKAR